MITFCRPQLVVSSGDADRHPHFSVFEKLNESTAINALNSLSLQFGLDPVNFRLNYRTTSIHTTLDLIVPLSFPQKGLTFTSVLKIGE